MSVLNVCALNQSLFTSDDFALRSGCRPVESSELGEPWFSEFVRDMFETLYHAPQGVGLAAPQVGMMIRLVVLDVKRDGKAPLLLVNPEFEPIGEGLVASRESCLSVPGYSGEVLRHERIHVSHLDMQGRRCDFEASGFKARAIQHEIDHLDGILYIDKLIEGSLKEAIPFEQALAARSLEALSIE